MLGAAVQFKGIGKRYGDVVALRDFDLEISPGEFMTLLGPSGSGKTTALNVLAGFGDATSGSVRIADRDVTSLPPEQRNVGMVFQSYSLFPHMSVFDNIAFPLKLRKMPTPKITERVQQALEMVRLPALAQRMPRELSGGQRQRIAFARAVVFEPPVLLLDEPMAALDLKLREAMQAEIKRYHRELGCTNLMVTHDQGEALGLSDRVVVISQGRIVQVDKPQKIYDAPVNRYVAEFVGRTNIFEQPGAGSAFLPATAATAIGLGLGQHSISVRPEKIRRITKDAANVVSFPASIVARVFQGDVVRYEAVHKSGQPIFFTEYRAGSDTLIEPGSEIWLGFRPEDALVLNKDGAQ